MYARAVRFVDHYALAELPYFELRDGRLVAAGADEWGPAIDAHTHLALSYVRRASVNLTRAHDRTRHYLPVDSPVNLDVYMNRNFSEEQLRALKRDLTLGVLVGGTMRATHTAANLTREMAELGIAASVLLPIDMPALSRNAEQYLEVARDTGAVFSLGSVHPHARNVRERLAAQKAAGARGVKVHPAVQLVAPDHPRAMSLYAACAQLSLPVFFHCGPVGIETRAARRRCQLERYVPPVTEHPDCTFVLGHSGALQMEQGLELARRHENVWLELASQSLSNVREILRRGPTDRILFGTDWPFYHQAPGLAKVLLATEGDPQLRRRVLHDNAARLFGL